MGYAGKLKEKHKAIELRKRGYSYSEILKQINVSKDTISRWCRDVKLTKSQKLRLYKKKCSGGLRGCIVGAKVNQRRREKLTRKLMKEGKKEVGRILKRDNFIVGIAMYFAEGTKASESVSFSNSDPRAIKFMIDWFQKHCKVPERKITCSLYIHDNLDEKKARKFWSELTGIPLDQFRKSYIVKNNPNRFRKTKNRYGVFRITINDVNLHRKIMGWISGIFQSHH